MMKFTICLFVTIFSASCESAVKSNIVDEQIESIRADTIRPLIAVNPQQEPIKPVAIRVTNGVTSSEVVQFAKTLSGIPYSYASIDPSEGFDCSGFITYVFNHFNIIVPRSSVDFTNVGKEVDLQNAKEGDLILFTGTVDSIRIVGHMGIVTENIDTLKFIHSTSGKAYGVTISVLNDHYKRRFVKVTRLFSE